MKVTTLTVDMLAQFFAYLDRHLLENGMEGEALFQPMSKSESILTNNQRASFAKGLEQPFENSLWRHVLVAMNDGVEIVGHVDIRHHKEKHTFHRGLLGIGVIKAYRKQGVANALMKGLFSFIKEKQCVDYVDLWIISENSAAKEFYIKRGFSIKGELLDMFRIDGQSIAYTLMSIKLLQS